MDRQDLFPVTIYLRNLIAGATGGSNVGTASDTALQIAASIQSVTIVLTVLPIMFFYPFIQRYFVSGVMLGAVKG
jgi:putative aldouronate transport system permease protein